MTTTSYTHIASPSGEAIKCPTGKWVTVFFGPFIAALKLADMARTCFILIEESKCLHIIFCLPEKKNGKEKGNVYDGDKANLSTCVTNWSLIKWHVVDLIGKPLHSVKHLCYRYNILYTAKVLAWLISWFQYQHFFLNIKYNKADFKLRLQTNRIFCFGFAKESLYQADKKYKNKGGKKEASNQSWAYHYACVGLRIIPTSFDVQLLQCPICQVLFHCNCAL